MTPYYDHDGVTIFHSSCEELLSVLGTRSVDLVLTDPPYNVGGEEGEMVPSGKAPIVRFLGEWDQKEWRPDILLAGSQRVLKGGGSLVSFCSDRLLGAYREASGWKPRGTVIWYKPDSPPLPRPFYFSSAEFIVWLQKPGGTATWNHRGGHRNVIVMSKCREGERLGHPTQKPLELVKGFIQRHSNPGDRVVDFYLGTGTTARACKDLGRRFIGCEIEARWCERAVSRLAQSVFPLEVS